MSNRYWIELECPYCKHKFFEFYNPEWANIIRCRECGKKMIVSMVFETSKFTKVNKKKVVDWESEVRE